MTLRSFLPVLQICHRQNRQNFADEILSESRQGCRLRTTVGNLDRTFKNVVHWNAVYICCVFCFHYLLYFVSNDFSLACFVLAFFLSFNLSYFSYCLAQELLTKFFLSQALSVIYITLFSVSNFLQN